MPGPANEEAIKQKIVDTYRRGVCDKDGTTLPRSQWGRNGKGSAFTGRQYYNDQFCLRYDLIDWSI